TLALVRHEKRLSSAELRDRIHAIAYEIETWPGIYTKLNTPMIPTVTAYHTLRDGTWVVVPTLMLVKGDIIALGYGERVPCSIKLVKDFDDSSSGDGGHGEHEFTLKRGQMFSPAVCSSWRFLQDVSAPSGGKGEAGLKRKGQPDGRTRFRVLETPLQSHLSKVLHEESQRHQTVLQNQILVVSRLLYQYVLPTTAVGAFVINFVRFIVTDVAQRQMRRMAIETIVGSVVHIVFPFAASMSLVWLWYLARHYANAHTLMLFEALQRSKTDFTDDADIDEFDVEAPAPTKDVVVKQGTVWRKMLWLFRNSDFRNFSRSTCLVESLGNITVIASIDREGTISHSFCTPEQLIVPVSDEDIAIFDLGIPAGGAGAPVIEDVGWERYIENLKPLGLNFLLNTNCNTFRGKDRSGVHKRFSVLGGGGSKAPTQEVCLCKLGKTIGFTAQSTTGYERLVNIHVFSPRHPATDQSSRREGHIAGLLATIVRGGPPGSDDSLQLFSSGDFSFIADHCTDYWDGRDVVPFEDAIMKRVYSCYENAKTHDLNCVAFAYRPVLPEMEPILMQLLTCGDGGEVDSADQPKRIYVESVDFDYNDLESASSQSSESQPADSKGRDGMESCGDEPDFGGSPFSCDKGHLKSSLVGESVTSRLDKFDDTLSLSIARQHSSPPLRPGETETRGPPGVGDNCGDQNDLRTPSSILLDECSLALLEDSDEPSLPRYLQSDVRNRKYKRKELTFGMRLGGGDAAATGDVQGFTKAIVSDLIESQTFLGMATMCYDPKTDVCDFIEDLSLAGIRFVYFSSSGGRQSKAFAERLGLETDWNTCILLSSSDDDDDSAHDGYVEDYDIKARLPRGIENIRQHLEEVDDIPLQVSLFAGCTPSAVREMINIFQENSEIVCCIGSALCDSNTLTFAEADIAVGVEPIPHFNKVVLHQRAPLSRNVTPPRDDGAPTDTRNVSSNLDGGVNDGSITTTGALLTQFALGAALTTIPCSLFLQHDTSLYALAQVTREARRLLGCINQAAIFLTGCYLSVAAVNIVVAATLLPPALLGYHALWLLWVVCPMLAASIFFVPHEANIMTTMPGQFQAERPLSGLSSFTCILYV
ncbi:hypothetical protein EV182_002280, partial [Spiromyces aspiralis]